MAVAKSLVCIKESSSAAFDKVSFVASFFLLMKRVLSGGQKSEPRFIVVSIVPFQIVQC